MVCCSGLNGLDFSFCSQKSAYWMRISDWSSDVCASDRILVIVDEQLPPGHRRKARQEGVIIEAEEPIRRRAGAVMRLGQEQHALLHDLGEHRQTVGIGMPAQ